MSQPVTCPPGSQACDHSETRRAAAMVFWRGVKEFLQFIDPASPNLVRLFYRERVSGP